MSWLIHKPLALVAISFLLGAGTGGMLCRIYYVQEMPVPLLDTTHDQATYDTTPPKQHWQKTIRDYRQ